MAKLKLIINTYDMIEAIQAHACLTEQPGWQCTDAGIMPIIYGEYCYDNLTQDQLFKIFDVLNNCTPETRRKENNNAREIL